MNISQTVSLRNQAEQTSLSQRMESVLSKGLLGGGKNPVLPGNDPYATHQLLQLVAEWKLQHTMPRHFLNDLEQFPVSKLPQSLQLSLRLLDHLSVEHSLRTNWRLFTLARKLFLVELERTNATADLSVSLSKAKVFAEQTKNHILLAEVLTFQNLLGRKVGAWLRESSLLLRSVLDRTPASPQQADLFVKGIPDTFKEANFLLRCDQLYSMEQDSVQHWVLQYLELSLHKTWRSACCVLNCVHELLQAQKVQPELVRQQVYAWTQVKQLKDSWRVQEVARHLFHVLEPGAKELDLLMLPQREALKEDPLVHQILNETRMHVRSCYAVPTSIVNLVWELASAYECAVWIDGRVKPELVWAELAVRLGIPLQTQQITQSMVRGYLSNKKTLIVLDRPQDLPELPITASLFLISDKQDLEGFTHVMPSWSTPVTRRLKTLFKNSSLAENLVAAYVSVVQPRSLDDYFSQIIELNAAEYHCILTTVVQISLQALKMPAARSLLELLALLNLPNVPEQLYAKALASYCPEVETPWQVTLAKVSLQMFRLISLPSATQISIDPEIAAIVNKTISNPTLIVNSWLHSLSQTINSADSPQDVQILPVAACLIERYPDWVKTSVLYHFALLCHEHARLQIPFSVTKVIHWAESLEDSRAMKYLARLGSFCTQTGKYQQAISCRNRCIAISTQLYGPESVQTVAAIQELARAQVHNQDCTTAVETYSLALATQYSLCPGKNLITAELLFELGQLHRRCKAFQRAVEPLTEAHCIRERELGSDHPLALAVIVELGKCHLALNHLAKAISCFEQALNSDSSVAAAYKGLGRVSRQQRDHAAALIHFRRAFQQLTRDYGECHPELCSILDELAEAHFAVGSPNLAEECFRSAIRLKRSFYSEHDHRLLRSYYDWGLACEHSGHVSMAIRHYKSALKLECQLDRNPANSFKRLGKVYKSLDILDQAVDCFNQEISYRMNANEDRDYVKALQNLAAVQRTLGCNAEARANCLRAIELTERLSYKDNSLYVKSYVLLGCLHQDHDESELAEQHFALAVAQVTSLRSNDAKLYAGLAQAGLGNHQKALDWYQAALTALEAKCRSNAIEAGILAYLSAVAYGNLNKLEEAKMSYKKGLAVLTVCCGKSSPQLVNPLNNLGSICYALNQFETALEYYLKAVEIQQRNDDTLKAIDTLCNIGLTYNRLRQNDTALRYYQQALDLQTRHGDDGKVATILNNIGVIQTGLQQYEQALELLRTALQKKQNMFGSVHLETATTLHALGACYAKQGNFKAALEHYNQALAIRTKELGSTHPSTMMTSRKIDQLYHLS